MYRILLVEDDEDMRLYYRKMRTWKECGFEITAEAGNGQEALAYLENHEVDLILTDIRMPFMDGIMFMRQLKEMPSSAIVVLMSSYSEFEYARQGLILGALDYLVKPFRKKQLVAMLERVAQELSKRQETDSLPDWIVKELQESDETLLAAVEEDSFLSKLFTYLARNIENQITMEMAADTMKLSKDYFGKMVKQKTGESFSNLSAKIKIAYAKYLLDQGDYKTYEISDLLGYSSPDYFTRIFKEQTGQTPSGYRKK